jgi:hypothetical protein
MVSGFTKEEMRGLNGASLQGCGSAVRVRKVVKPAIRRNKRGQYSIDLMEARKQVEAGTLPAAHRHMIERIMGDVLPMIDPVSGKLKNEASTRTSHPDPQPTSIQPQKEEKP